MANEERLVMDLSMDIYWYMKITRRYHKRNIMVDDGLYKYRREELLDFLGMRKNVKSVKLIDRIMRTLELKGLIEIVDRRLYGTKRSGKHGVYIIRFKEGD